MGEIIDNETGEEPRCPLCKRNLDACPHLVIEIDVTFGECRAGAFLKHAEELARKFDEAVQRMASRGALPQFKDHDLQEVIDEGADGEDPTEHTWSGNAAYWRAVENILFEHGAIPIDGDISEEGGPGQSSTLRVLVAEDPDQTCLSAREHLEVAIKEAEGSSP